MKSTILSCSIEGTEPQIVRVESSFTSGFPGIQIVGNAKDACREAKDRAKVALEFLGRRFGQKRILVNLAPANSQKNSTHFDLPIALSIAALTCDNVSVEPPQKWLFAAELGIDGTLHPCRALVPMALCALQKGLRGLVLASEQRTDTRQIEKTVPFLNSLQFLHFDKLKDVIDWYFHGASIPEVPNDETSSDNSDFTPNFDDMVLDETLEELALTCAVGRHHVLLRGTPGSGKSMFAQRLQSLLPNPSTRQLPEILSIYSRLHETLPGPILQGLRPYRSPHHSSSLTALLGNEREPGELSLAHAGLLFLDEFPEFRRDLIEALREPLELGYIQISRAGGKVRWPADIHLIAACNNCPCGWLGSKNQLCRCSYSKISSYWQRLSGPLLDRIDIHFMMPERSLAARTHRLSFQYEGRTKRLIGKIQHIQSFQKDLRDSSDLATHPMLSQQSIFKTSGCTEKEFQAHLNYLESLSISARSFIRVIRVARTLADIRLSAKIDEFDVYKAASWHHSMMEKEFGAFT